MSSATVTRYATPVYVADFSASGLPSLLEDRNSLDAMESVAAMPVIRPDSAINCVFCMASVRPANVPVISTMASFMPNTMLPT